MTPPNKFITSFGAVCRTDVQMTWILHAHWRAKMTSGCNTLIS